MGKLTDWLNVDAESGAGGGTKTIKFYTGGYKGRTGHRTSVYIRAKYNTSVEKTLAVTVKGADTYITFDDGVTKGITNSDGTSTSSTYKLITVTGKSNCAGLKFEQLNEDGSTISSTISGAPTVNPLDTYTAAGQSFANAVVSSTMASLGLAGEYSWSCQVPVTSYGTENTEATRSFILRVTELTDASTSDTPVYGSHQDLIITQTRETANIVLSPESIELTGTGAVSVNVQSNCSWEISKTV